MKIKKVTHYVSEEGFEFTFQPIEDIVQVTAPPTKVGGFLVQRPDLQLAVSLGV